MSFAPKSLALDFKSQIETQAVRPWGWVAVSRALAFSAVLILASSARAQNTFAPQPVASRSAEQAIVVKATRDGTVKTVEVLTAGNPAGDFAASSGSSTCPGASLAAGASCSEFVTMTPSVPGLRTGAVVLLDGNGQALGVTMISGVGRGGLGVLVPGNVSVVAGVPGVFSGTFDGGSALSASLDLPAAITMDGAGNMYIADSLHNRVRMVCGTAATATIANTTCTTAGNISTIAGSDSVAYTGDGGPASEATFNTPNGLAVDGAGNLYIADTGNNAIRMISAASGKISTVAGGVGPVCASAVNSVGDGCPATQAELYQPWGITVDAAGNLYIADTFHHRIREVDWSTGMITTVAGSGFTQADGSGGFAGDNGPAVVARLNFPFAVAFDPQGNMYIPDSGNQRIREVLAVNGAITPAGNMVTFAGTGQVGGNRSCLFGSDPVSQAEFAWPEAVAVDAAGNVYVADAQNAGVRKINASTLNLTSLVQAGCGDEHNYGTFAPAYLYGPKALYVDGQGDVYIADYYDMVVQEVQSNYAAIDDYTLDPVLQGTTIGPTLQQVENDGNAPLNLTSITAGTNSAIDNTVTNACTTGSLAVDASCMIGAEFAPAAAPVLLAPQDESGTITADEEAQPSVPAASNPLRIEVFGYAGPGHGTVTTVTSTPNPSGYGKQVAIMATVSAGAGGTVDGTVTFIDTYNGATTTLANQSFDYNSAPGLTRTATLLISSLGVGRHTIVATYSGDPNHFGSSSTDNHVAPLIQIVQASSSTTLTSSLNPSTVGAAVTFTAVVVGAPSNVIPQGTVDFMDGTTRLGSVALVAVKGGQEATFTTSGLANGPHSITAVYDGDTVRATLGSTSEPVQQDVQAPAKLGIASDLNPSYQGNNVIFTATVNSTATKPATGSITFFDNGVQIGTGTLSGNPAVAKIATSTLALGTHPISASYTGDSYNTSTESAIMNQVVTLDAFSVTVTPANLTLKAGANATVTVIVNSIGGYGDSITMGCASLPARVNCEFKPFNLNLPASGSVTGQLTIDTNNPLSGGPSAMNRPRNAGATLAGLLPICGAFFGWVFWRQRRRGFRFVMLVLAVALSSGMLLSTGCGNGISLSSATPGTYTIQVSGTGASSYFTRYQDVKLTITQ